MVLSCGLWAWYLWFRGDTLFFWPLWILWMIPLSRSSLDTLFSKGHANGGVIGPHGYYEIIRIARQERTTIIRVLFAAAVFLALAWAYGRLGTSAEHNDIAQLNAEFAATWFVVQNLAILLLTPVFLGSAVAEERERGTLELLFTTQLSDRAIVLGKVLSRGTHVVGILLAGVPVFLFTLAWGGIDLVLLLGNFANSLLLLVLAGSVSVAVSTLARTTLGGIRGALALLIPGSLALAAITGGFPLLLGDTRVHATIFAVQNLPSFGLVYLWLSLLALGLAVRWLRRSTAGSFGDGLQRNALPPLSRPPIKPGEVRPLSPPAPERTDALGMMYDLPPVWDDALSWKERCVGGPHAFFSSLVLVLLLTFSGTALFVMTVLGVIDTITDQVQPKMIAPILLLATSGVLFTTYAVGTAFRAASSVARERQQHTLDLLLVLPVAPSEILWAKGMAPLWQGWPVAAMFLVSSVLGTAMGIMHAVDVGCLTVLAAALVVFLDSLGLMLSVLCPTVRAARICLALVLSTMIGAWLLVGSPLAMFAKMIGASAEDGDRASRSFVLLSVATLLIAASVACGWIACIRLRK